MTTYNSHIVKLLAPLESNSALDREQSVFVVADIADAVEKNAHIYLYKLYKKPRYRVIPKERERELNILFCINFNQIYMNIIIIRLEFQLSLYLRVHLTKSTVMFPHYE